MAENIGLTNKVFYGHIPEENVYYVALNGSDDSTGTKGDPFRTIEYANNHAIANIPSWPHRVMIKVAPGLYTGEHITQAHYRVHIVGNIRNLDHRERDVIIANLGTNAATYPLGMNDELNLDGITVATMDAIYDNYVSGVFGTIMSMSQFSNCTFRGGYFVEQEAGDAEGLFMDFRDCFFTGDGFKLAAVTRDFNRFIALRDCDLSQGTSSFESSGTMSFMTVKLENTMLGNPLNMKGDWNTLVQWSELYSSGEIVFDTTGWVDIFSSILINKIHFTTDPVGTKKLVNCLFRNIPAGLGDVTADVNVEFIEYTGNHQCNGIDGEIMTTNKLKKVAGGQNYYRTIHEALLSCNQDSVVDLEGDVAITEPLAIPAGYDVIVDGNKKWSLSTTHATTLVDLGVNQHLSFVNMKRITGGKKAIVNGNNAALSFIDCGRYTEPCYVNIELNAGNIESFLHVVQSSIIGTSAPAVKVNDVDVWIVIDRIFLKGAAGQPAIEWSVEADSHFKAKYSTFIHGSGGANSPLTWPTAGANQITLSIYNCALNAAFPVEDFTNNIGSPNNTIDPQIDY